jgi:hypothetical protein
MAAAPPAWLTLPEDEFQDQYRPAHNATRSYLHRALLRALGSAVERLPTDDELQQKPLVIDLARPLPNGELNALHWILELEAGEDARSTVASGYAAEVLTRDLTQRVQFHADRLPVSPRCFGTKSPALET